MLQANQLFSTYFNFFVKFLCKFKKNKINKTNPQNLLDQTDKYINRDNKLYKDYLYFEQKFLKAV